MSKESIEERVQKFQTMSLPGQPMGMHMGTYYLVSDMQREIERLRALLREARISVDWNANMMGSQADALLLPRIDAALNEAQERHA